MARILDVLEYVDPSGRELVHRIPAEGQADIMWGAQLIVREAQSAVFFRDGRALDVFEPGRHTLTTTNLPLLLDLLKGVASGKTPFAAEVFFVNRQVFTDLRWGTQEPIPFRDAELAMVRLRSFGTYAIRVSDPQLFVNTLVGGRGLYTIEALGDYLTGLIVARLNDLLGSVMKTVLDLAVKYDELGAAMKSRVLEDLAQYGIELKDFFVQSITPPEEVQKMIDERSGMAAVGDMNRFMQYKTAQAIQDMARQPGGEGGSAMGMGAGFGMGMMIPGMVQQAIAGQSAVPVGAAAARPASPPVMGPVVVCPACSAQSPQGARFCAGCGQALAGWVCSACQVQQPPGARFCSNCGAAQGGAGQ